MADDRWKARKLAELGKLARESIHGETGLQRERELLAFLDEILAEYAQAFGMTEGDLLEGLEKRRNYSVLNFYQRANFPALADVRIFDSLKDFKRQHPSGRYVCPSCNGASTSPYECNSGVVRDERVCNWKSYGLFGTLGKGMKLALRDQFAGHPIVEEIFMPVEAASQPEATPA